MDETIRQAAIAGAAAAGEAIGDPVGEKLADFLERLAGDAIDGLGKRLSAAVAGPAPQDDSLAAVLARWRSRNVVLVLRQANAILDGAGAEARQVPATFLVPLLDSASQTSDETLREWWATLLANGVQLAEVRHPMWIRILAQMSDEDAREFARACEATDTLHVSFICAEARPAWRRSATSAAGARLETLGLVTQWSTADIRESGSPVGVQVAWPIALTELGAQFRHAVRQTSRPPAP